MAKDTKFKVLTKNEYKSLSKEEKKEYEKNLKVYKKELKKNKPKKTRYQKRMAIIKIVGIIMAISFALGILVSIFAPLMYK